jgi:hypothetical protein
MARQGKVKVSSLSRHRHGDVIQRVGYPCMNPWMYKAQPRPTYRTGRSPSGVQEKEERPWPGSAPVPEPSLSAGAPGKRESQRGPSITATFRIAGSAAASPALTLESIESSTTVLAGASVLCLPHLHRPRILYLPLSVSGPASDHPPFAFRTRADAASCWCGILELVTFAIPLPKTTILSCLPHL